MADKVDLKELWAKQQAEKPDVDMLFKRIGRFKKKHLIKLVKANLLLIVTVLFNGFVWFYFQPQMLTTKIGICLVIIGIAVFLFVYNKMIPLLWNSGYEMNSRQYLQQLIKLKEKRLFLQNTIISIYYLLLTVGIGLYMIEYTLLMKMIWAIIIYVIVLLWIGFTWFYIRPKKLKKQKDAINTLINKLREMV